MHSVSGEDRMNEKGNVILLIVAGLLLVVILPPIIFYAFPPAALVFQLISIFIIYSTVRGYLGPGVLTIAVSAILIYFLVFKYFYIYSGLFMFQLLLGMGFLSVIVWGVGTRLAPAG